MKDCPSVLLFKVERVLRVFIFWGSKKAWCLGGVGAERGEAVPERATLARASLPDL